MTLKSTLALDRQKSPVAAVAKQCGMVKIACESCDQWYHIEYEGLGVEIHQLLCERESYSWVYNMNFIYNRCFLPHP